MHLNLPIIDQAVVMTVPAALCTQRLGFDARIEGMGAVDRAMDHWALWLLADGALGMRNAVTAPTLSRAAEANQHTGPPDSVWVDMAERVASHEAARARHAGCTAWNLQRLQQAHAELGVLHGSELRDVPAWFGGATPSTARHFAPQPELLRGLLDDLLQFANLRPNASFLQAVLAHYQVVMIHPFRDGNGRLARLFAACLLERARRPLAPLYAGFALQRWGHAHDDDALEAMAQGDVDAYITWWARAHRFASMLVAAVDAERRQLSAHMAAAVAPSVRMAAALARAILRSPCLALSRFAEVHGLNAQRQRDLARVLEEHGWHRIDAKRWLCVSTLARLLTARKDLYARHRRP